MTKNNFIQEMKCHEKVRNKLTILPMYSLTATSTDFVNTLLNINILHVTSRILLCHLHSKLHVSCEEGLRLNSVNKRSLFDDSSVVEIIEIETKLQ